jgi:hypothetical protein
MFIYTGLLKATENEAQLAGVMGHEMSHVILRHGTHEATKANGIAMLAGGLGSILGGGKITQSILGMGANSVVLKFSRDAESEADALGSHLMADSGYDPVEMARFFEKLNASGGQQLQILSDHPNPGNREVAIKAEVQTLPAHKYGYDTGQFAQVKKLVAALPPPTKKPGESAPAPGSAVPPAGGPSDFASYQGQGFAIKYPQDWQVFGQANAVDVTLAPRDGVVSKDGGTQIGFGAVIGRYAPANGRTDLRSATADLIKKLKSDNGQMTAGTSQSATLGSGLQALTTTLHSNSVYGGNEVDTVVTVVRGQQLWYVVFVSPEKDADRVQGTFKQMLDSVSFQ